MGRKLTDAEFDRVMSFMNPEMVKQASNMMKNNPDLIKQASQRVSDGTVFNGLNNPYMNAMPPQQQA